MTNQDESKGASNGIEGRDDIDNSGMDTHPDLRADELLTTNSGQTSLNDNESQSKFGTGNEDGPEVDEEDSARVKDAAVN